ncbi:dipeptidase [Rhodoferax fermentans]|uniref:Peptidase M19 n=1 Tax=Rhodoferax fermentans TaxID=28066 RepID=A0A1T1ATC2_RHOFE|nr:membrane dipeptidase [Rhodoferax fermentans]MBK1685115.1 peptidase M19 [Rhodoferax fermentans]OOV07340.1 peptidase M19 [Rhodoferax fermentans]
MTRWDAHMCLPLHPQASFAPINQLRSYGLNYVSINVGMDMNPLPQIMSVIAGYRATIAAHPDKYVQVNNLADIARAQANGQIAIGFDLEGAMPLLEQPEMVALYARLGVRQIHFAYNRNNSVADGCHDEKRGLTALGRQMVETVNAAGLLIDCSHTGRNCSLEIMAASSQPVAFSHANPLALVDHGRNITDEQIRACAATGGVVCVSGVSRFLGVEQPSVVDVARHAAYVANLVGIDHVGIGLDNGFSQPELNDTPPGDFDPSYWWPQSAGYGQAISGMHYAPIDTWQQLPEALCAVGMSEAEAKQVLGGNMLRVAGQVWAAKPL